MLLFARPRSFNPDPSLDVGQQRGAELVEGLAHCGACHTPRGLAFQEKAMADDGSRQFLSGSVLEGWYAKNLRNESTGLASWSEGEIVDTASLLVQSQAVVVPPTARLVVVVIRRVVQLGPRRLPLQQAQ